MQNFEFRKLFQVKKETFNALTNRVTADDHVHYDDSKKDDQTK